MAPFCLGKNNREWFINNFLITTNRIFIDGVLLLHDTEVAATITDFNVGNIRLGGNTSENKPMNGYISNFRITLGTPSNLYDQTGFTPPTSALSPRCKAHLHANGCLALKLADSIDDTVQHFQLKVIPHLIASHRFLLFRHLLLIFLLH